MDILPLILIVYCKYIKKSREQENQIKIANYNTGDSKLTNVLIREPSFEPSRTFVNIHERSRTIIIIRERIINIVNVNYGDV